MSGRSSSACSNDHFRIAALICKWGCSHIDRSHRFFPQPRFSAGLFLMQKASVSIFLNNAENLQNEFEIGSTNMEGKTGKTENSIQNSHYGRGGRLILPGVQ